jgi:hypothetical protein
MESAVVSQLLEVIASVSVTDYLTATMAIATVWLAVETRAMARAANESIRLQAQPFLSFAGVDAKLAQGMDLKSGQATKAIRLALRLSNPGKVMINYAVKSISCSLTFPAGRTEDLDTKGGVIFPDQETLFLLPFTPLPTGSQVAPSSEMAFQIEYWSEPGERKCVRAKVAVTFTNHSPLDWQWVFIEGPTYA